MFKQHCWRNPLITPEADVFKHDSAWRIVELEHQQSVVHCDEAGAHLEHFSRHSSKVTRGMTISPRRPVIPPADVVNFTFLSLNRFS